MAINIRLSELTDSIEKLSNYDFKENVKHFEKLYCDDDVNTFHGFSSQASYEEMLKDVLRVNGGKHHILYPQLILKIANERLKLEDRLRKFLNKVVKDEYGETELNTGDVILFFSNATMAQLKELEDDFFYPFTSKLADEDDYNLDELFEFIREVVNDGDTVSARY